jgi:hypothetical protein
MRRSIRGGRAFGELSSIAAFAHDLVVPRAENDLFDFREELSRCDEELIAAKTRRLVCGASHSQQSAVRVRAFAERGKLAGLPPLGRGVFEASSILGLAEPGPNRRSGCPAAMCGFPPPQSGLPAAWSGRAHAATRGLRRRADGQSSGLST